MVDTLPLSVRAAVYTRISRDLAGMGAGVARQEQDCAAKAAELGWDVSRVYTDNDMSAYSGKPRPQYQAMLEAIDSGEVDAVLVWHTDRLYRRIAELEQYIAVCEKRRVPTQTVKAGPLDLATPSGRMVARQLGAVAVYESEQKSERQKRANLQRAQQGRHFGTRRTFGFELDGITIRQAEATAIRDACALILSGGSLREVARRWNDAGLLTPQRGNRWEGTVVCRTMKTARLAGIKTYHHEIVRGADGEPVETEWPAIVDIDTWQAVQAVLDDPSRRTSPTFYSKLLLSGVARCAACGAGIQSGGKRKGRGRYRCSSKGGHVYRASDPIDVYVEAVVLRRLAMPDALGLLRPAAPQIDVGILRREAAGIHQVMDGLAEAFADGGMTLSALKAGMDRAQRRLADVEGKITKTAGGRNGALAHLATARDLERSWSELSTDAKRSVITTLMTVRLVAPGTKENGYLWEDGKQVVNPETVIIDWNLD